MALPLWAWAGLAAALAQTGRNAAQSGLTARLGTLGATNVRFLFGLPFAALFLWLALLWTGEPLPMLTLRAIGFTAMGSLAQIAATALMLQVVRTQGFGITTAWLKVEPVLVALVGWVVLGDPLTLPMLGAIGVAVAGVLVLTLKPGTGRAMLTGLGPAGMGLLAGLAFGLAAIGFRGGITVNSPAFSRRLRVSVSAAVRTRRATASRFSHACASDCRTSRCNRTHPAWLLRGFCMSCV